MADPQQKDPKKFFSPEEEKQVTDAIKAAENRTSGEIRVHLEAHTDEPNREHAKKVFEEGGMTETERRNGVLFYLAIRDKQFSILGDKGINEVRFAEGLAAGIQKAGKALQEYFPIQDDDSNELSDEISTS